MSTTEIQADVGESTSEAIQAQTQEPTFTQADVDRIVKERIKRAEAKFAEASASESRTLEQRLAEVEARAVRAETERLRSDIAAKFGVAPEDRDLFLTGTDEDTLTAQAKRLAERESERKKHGNVAPREGATTNSGESDGLRDFAKTLFASANE
jgi:hypothetical protein